MPATPPASRPASSAWAFWIGVAVLSVCGGGWWFLARPRPAEAPSDVLARFVGRWTPDWEAMRGQPGTLGAARRGEAASPDLARGVESWKRKGIQLVVDAGGEVRVVADAEPGSPTVSRHAATVEGPQLRLRGLEADGKPLPPAYVTVLRFRRDGVLVWIPLYGGSNELTVLLRRP